MARRLIGGNLSTVANLDDYPQTVALGPNDLDVPMGITGGAWILMTALEEGIKNLRVNPWLLDFCWARWRQDDLTRERYGQKVIDRLKTWFLSRNLPVYVTPRPEDGLQYPCISVREMSSQEVENTLGDVNYSPIEVAGAVPDAISSPFAPLSWDPATRRLGIPPEIWPGKDEEGRDVGIILVPGQTIIEGVSGRRRSIVAVNPPAAVDEAPTVTLEEGSEEIEALVALGGKAPTHAVRVEAVNFRTVYQIGIHVPGEPMFAESTWAMISFILLSRRKDLLERRGLENSNFTSSGTTLSGPQPMMERSIQLTATVRQYVPAQVGEVLWSEHGRVTIDGARVAIDDLPGWLGNGDPRAPEWVQKMSQLLEEG